MIARRSSYYLVFPCPAEPFSSASRLRVGVRVALTWNKLRGGELVVKSALQPCNSAGQRVAVGAKSGFGQAIVTQDTKINFPRPQGGYRRRRTGRTELEAAAGVPASEGEAAALQVLRLLDHSVDASAALGMA